MRSLPKFAAIRSRTQRVAETLVCDLQHAELAVNCDRQPGGGDCHDFLRVSATKVCFALLDVAGRRVENNGVVSAAQNVFRSSAGKLLANDDANEADAMIEICHQLNRTILQTAGRICSCPAFAGCFNESLGTLCYFNAGHTPGLLGDQTGITDLPATGLPLGLFSHGTADAAIIALPPGAAMLVVSRGMVEARRSGEEFGLRRVRESFGRSITKPANQICSTVLGQLQSFMHGRPIRNDVTALALARDARAAAFAR